MTVTDFQFKTSSGKNSDWKKSKLFLSTSYRKLELILSRLIWHVKGYGTIAGMMVLVLLSMMYLNLHDFLRKFSRKISKKI